MLALGDLISGGHWMVPRYPTDLTDTEWTLLAPLIPAAKPGGRPRTTDMREVVNAILQACGAGPSVADVFPPILCPIKRSTIISGPGDAQASGNGCTTASAETCARPRAARGSPVRGLWIVQTVKTTEGGSRGYDGGKHIRGRKRHIVVDVLGLLLVVIVHRRGSRIADGAKQVLTALVARLPGLQLIWADGGYAGKLVASVTTILSGPS